MRRSILLFLSTTLLSLLVIPIINILSTPNNDIIKLKEESLLYNVDFASSWMAKFLYPFGISTHPKQVLIGKDDWLYLGTSYTQSADRHPPTKADIAIGKQIGAATKAWDVYLKHKGVKIFRVMIGPNKSTIYPEHMPLWAKPALFNVTDALLAETGNRLYVDLREPLLAAKYTHLASLYYKTDTHWNLLGGGVAFRSFAKQVSAAAPELEWPLEKAYELDRIDLRGGGDLANFLRLTEHLSDYEPKIHASNLPVETTQYDFDTNKMIHKGGNPAVDAPTKPLLVKSVGALNNKRVLWLRDSFGTSLSSLMAATFSETLQLHWAQAINPSGRLVELVEKWKPDYVFFTVVERNARSTAFSTFPPHALEAVQNEKMLPKR